MPPPERALRLRPREEQRSLPRTPVRIKVLRTALDLDVVALARFPSECDRDHMTPVITIHSIFAGYVSYPIYPRWFAPRNRRL